MERLSEASKAVAGTEKPSIDDAMVGLDGPSTALRHSDSQRTVTSRQRGLIKSKRHEKRISRNLQTDKPAAPEASETTRLRSMLDAQCSVPL